MSDSPKGGKPQAGWSKQTFTVPDSMRQNFVREADRRDSVSVKLMGTAAMGVFLGMPEETRSRFLLEVTRASFETKMEDIGERGYYDLMIRAMVATGELDRVLRDAGLEMREAQPQPEHEPSWYVSRILDPEVTPLPGQKQSDREQAAERRRSG